VFRGDRDVPAGSCSSPQTTRAAARHAGIKNAQALLGHADVGTTQMYTGAPTLDELAKAIEGYRSGVERTRST